jgi:ATP-dependent protease ClpP protease subunit
VGNTLIRNAAIGVHHTATEDSAWDGPAAVAAMPDNAATLHYCHAWEDEAGSDIKGDYKFPHHRTKGGPANIPACENGLARLSSASIPDGDRAGVKAHLQAHIDDHKKSGADGDADDSVTQLLSRRREALKATAKAANGGRKWYSIQARAAADNEYDIMITGEIGWDVDSGMFARALADPEMANATTLHVSLNSIGGDVFDGIGIYNALIGHGAQVVMTVTGLAASIASVIMMAGDKVVVGRGSEVMIHDAHAVQVGNAKDMAKMAEILDKASDNIASFYAERAGGDPADWRAIMRDEKWYSAQEAVDAGLADEVAPVRERVTGDASAITLAARAPRRARPVAVAGDEGSPDKPAVDGLTDWLAGLTDELRDEFAPPPDAPVADLGEAIRSAVAFVATDMPEPQTTPVDDSLPGLTSDHLADIRRAVQGE